MVDAINEESAFAVYKITNPVVGNQHSSPKKKKKKQKMNNKALKHDKQNNKKISHVLKSIDPVELLAQGKPIMKDKKVNGVDKKKSNKSRKEKLKPLLNGDSDVPILQKINSSKSFELNLPKTTKSKTAKKQKSNKEIPIVDDSEEYEFVTTDSYEEGKDLFSWLIAPYSADDFFK